MKKIIQIMAVFLLTTLLLTACKPETKNSSGKGSSKTKASGSEIISVAEETESSEESAVSSAAEKVSSAKSSSKASTSSRTLPKTNTSGLSEVDTKKLTLPELTVKNKTIKVLGVSGPSPEYGPAIDLLKTKYGVSLSLTTCPGGGEGFSQLQTMILADNSPDLMKYEADLFPVAATKNLIQPINKFIDFNDLKFTVFKDDLDNYKIGGNYYLWGKNRYMFVVWYNKTIFNSMGKKTPLHYFQQGTWTWDKLFELAQEMTSIDPITKKTSIYGYGDSSGQGGSYLASTGVDMVVWGSDNKLKNNLDNPTFERLRDPYCNLRTKGYIFPKNQAVTDFSQGKIAMFEGTYYDSLPGGFAEKVRQGKVSFVPVPRDAQSSKYNYFNMGEGYVVPIGAKNVDGVNAYINCLAYYGYLQEKDTEENKLTVELMHDLYGYTDLEFEVHDYILNKTVPVVQLYQGVGGAKGWLGFSWEMYNDMFERGVSWAAAKATYSPKLDSEIAKLYK